MEAILKVVLKIKAQVDWTRVLIILLIPQVMLWGCSILLNFAIRLFLFMISINTVTVILNQVVISFVLFSCITLTIVHNNNKILT